MHSSQQKSRFSPITRIIILGVVLFLFVFLATIITLRRSQKQQYYQEHLDNHNNNNNNNNKEVHAGAPNEQHHHDHNDEIANFGQDDQAHFAATRKSRRNREEASEIGAFDTATQYAADICEKASPGKGFLRHVIGTAHRWRGANPVPQDDTRKRKKLFFVGDSNALRMFRWTALLLRFQARNYVQPASVDYISDFIPYNLDSGIKHDRELITIDLVNNPNRLSQIEFRRAPFLEDVGLVLNDVATNVVREEKNFQAIVWISVASWDLLRPIKKMHGYTIDSLFSKFVLPRKNKKSNDGPSDAKELLQEVDEAELSQTHDKIMRRWKESCDSLNEALISAFGWGSDVEPDHHIRRRMMRRGTFQRVSWKLPTAPNCTAPRFHPPRASKALEFACPYFANAERFWWEGFMSQAREEVDPLKAKKSDDYGNDPVFEFLTDNDHKRSSQVFDCAEKKDGVHPSHLCVAKEAAAYLVRLLS